MGDLLGSCLSWGGPWDLSDLASTNVLLSLACLGLGGCLGMLSASVVTHALLPTSSLRLVTLIAMPTLAGYQTSRLLDPQAPLTRRLTSRAFWLTFWGILAFLAMRLLHIIR